MKPLYIFTLTIFITYSQTLSAQNCPFTLHKPVIDGNKVCFAVSSPLFAQLTYSWDFDGDGTFDTTTADSAVCHVYSAPDTYTAVVRVTDSLGCENSDSERVVIEKRGYVFVPELLCSLDLSGYSDFSDFQLRDGDFIFAFIELDSTEQDSCKAGNIFYKNKYLGRFINLDPSRNIGSFLLLTHSKYCEAGKENGSVLIDSLGNRLWESRHLWNPQISPNDSLIGFYSGDIGGGSDSEPKSFFSWEYYAGANHDASIIETKTGNVLYSLDGDTISELNVGLFNFNVSKFYLLYGFKLEGYDNHLEKIFTISPIINYPSESILILLTLPIFDQSKEDSNIYIYAAYNHLRYSEYKPKRSLVPTFGTTFRNRFNTPQSKLFVWTQ
jgi:hypothetical protein